MIQSPPHLPAAEGPRRPLVRIILAAGAAALAAGPAAATVAMVAPPGLAPFGVPVEFLLFAATLLGVAFLHRHTLVVALGGLAVIVLCKLVFTGFPAGPGLAGFAGHLHGEWVVLANLLGLLTGFALLARHFEDSRLPAVLPRVLPAGWPAGFVLLVMIFVLSGFLDNIAAALIGGTLAAGVFRHRIHIGYLAAIVAAANAGGSGSVVGDTTTTMMWLSGVGPGEVVHAYLAAGSALLVFGLAAARQQHRYQPAAPPERAGTRVDWARLGIVAAILLAAVAANLLVNLYQRDLAERFPVLGAAVWAVLIASTPLRRPAWGLLPDTLKGSLFLLSLVLCASLMPVERLPPPSPHSALTLGFVSAVFDNIPLTALALRQGGYDWGVLAYAVGFGGSMIWFGSSAGVALASLHPPARSVVAWVRAGWHVPVAYVTGFAVLLALMGWNPVGPPRPPGTHPHPAAAQGPPTQDTGTP